MSSKKEGIITVDNIDLDKNTIDLSIFVKDVSLKEVTFPIKAILYDKDGLQAYDESKANFYDYVGTYITDVTIESDYRVLPFMAYASETEINKLSKFNDTFIDEDIDEKDELVKAIQKKYELRLSKANAIASILDNIVKTSEVD